MSSNFLNTCAKFQKYQAKKAIVEAAMKADEEAFVEMLNAIERDESMSEREKENLISKLDDMACTRFGHAVTWSW